VIISQSKQTANFIAISDVEQNTTKTSQLCSTILSNFYLFLGSVQKDRTGSSRRDQQKSRMLPEHYSRNSPQDAPDDPGHECSN